MSRRPKLAHLHQKPVSGARLPLLILALLGGAAPVSLGCAEPKPPISPERYSENAKRAYQRAMQALEDKNWESVEPLFNAVRRDYSFSRYARLAELRLADANYEQEKLPEAISGYKAFIHDYPNDPEVPYARYRIAKSEYDSVSESVLLPPLEERDLSTVIDARGTILAYLEDYPESEHAVDLRYMLEVVIGVLARHELYVARYYLGDDRFEAAALRVGSMLEKFPDSGLVPEALLLYAEIRLKQKDEPEARQLLHRLIDEHASSPFSVPARRTLARLGEPVAVLRQPAASAVPSATTAPE